MENKSTIDSDVTGNQVKLEIIPNIPVVPSKSEMRTAITKYYADDSKSLIEKYVTLKALENITKEAFKIPNKKDIIESALEYSKGDTTFDCNGAQVKITRERISTTVTKYQFSAKTEELRKKNDLKVQELKDKIKLLNDEVKNAEVREINNDIAVEIKEALTGEAAEPEYGITVTLPK